MFTLYSLQLLTEPVDKQGSSKEVAPGFPLFKASHILDDVMMAVNLVVSVLMIGSVLFAYRQKLEWKDAKPLFMMTVPMYVYMTDCADLPSFTLHSSLCSACAALLFSLARARPLQTRYVDSF